VAGSPVIGRRRGAFSTLLRQSGLRASIGGVLATKSERKMLASTCLYSLYAWFSLVLCGITVVVVMTALKLVRLVTFADGTERRGKQHRSAQVQVPCVLRHQP